jgi:hypothetical protein
MRIHRELHPSSLIPHPGNTFLFLRTLIAKKIVLQVLIRVHLTQTADAPMLSRTLGKIAGRGFVEHEPGC